VDGIAGADVVPIVAVALGRVIGLENRLPWRLPEDLQRFKALTMGHPIVMGRKTFESLGRLLPQRTHIVVTRQRDYKVPDGARVAATPFEALEAAAALDEQVFVIGGAELYAATLPHATRIEATLVYGRFRGDAFFPTLDQGWHVRSREDRQSAAEPPLRFSFVTLRRDGDPGRACILCRLGRDEPASPWDAGFAEVMGALTAP
jgi:dihydrofolate reductase